MIKVFLIALSFPILAFSTQQIILVVTKDFKAPTGILSAYDGNKKVFENISVNVGKKGLGWGKGLIEIPHKSNEPVKQEGDKKAPAGIFALTHIFSYHKLHNTGLPFLYATQELICVDDSNSPNYNRIIRDNKDEKSFERILRKDGLYEYGVVVGHNQNQLKGAGSCIFLHIERGKNIPTVGCTSMKKNLLVKIIKWLDEEKKPLLIQVPKKYLEEVYKRYPQLKEY